MKKIFTTILSFALTTLAFAQLLPNGGFETVNGNIPANWNVTSGRTKSRTVLNLSVSGTAVTINPGSGSKFIGLLNDSPAVNNRIVIGRMSTAFPMNRRPASLKFKCQYLTSVTTESFIAFITFFQSNNDRRDTLLIDFVALSTRGLVLGNNGAWVTLTKPINYADWDSKFPGLTADSVSVEFLSTGNFASGTSSTSLSTELLLDDVEFTTWNTGTSTIVTAENQTEISNYPNPFNGVTAINYSLALNSENVNLSVVDINGKQVFTKDLGKQDAGDVTINFDGSFLKDGVYFYTVTSDNNRETGKMVITK